MSPADASTEITVLSPIMATCPNAIIVLSLTTSYQNQLNSLIDN